MKMLILQQANDKVLHPVTCGSVLMYCKNFSSKTIGGIDWTFRPYNTQNNFCEIVEANKFVTICSMYKHPA